MAGLGKRRTKGIFGNNKDSDQIVRRRGSHIIEDIVNVMLAKIHGH